MGEVRNRKVSAATAVANTITMTIAATDFVRPPTIWQLALSFDQTPGAGSYAVSIKSKGSDQYETLYLNGVAVVIQAVAHPTLTIKDADLEGIKLVPTGVTTATTCTATLSGW